MSYFSNSWRVILNDKGVKNLKQLSVLSHVAYGTVRDFALKDASPRQTTLLKLAKALGVSTDYLLTGKEPEPALSSVDLDDTYITVPLKYEIAAGEPRHVPLDFEDEIILHRSVTKRAGVNKKYLKAFRVVGDSMTPQLHSGDIIVCAEDPDILSRRIDQQALYCVHDSDDGGITVKRVIYEKDAHVLFLHPLNPEFRIQRIKLRKNQKSPIIGKVIGAWKNM